VKQRILHLPLSEQGQLTSCCDQILKL